MSVWSLSKPRTARKCLEARSRQDIFRHACSVVFEEAPAWGEDDAVVLELRNPLLGREDVEGTFEGISEKFNVSGIDLRFWERPRLPLQRSSGRVGARSPGDPELGRSPTRRTGPPSSGSWTR
jgi:hypothetical protein